MSTVISRIRHRFGIRKTNILDYFPIVMVHYRYEKSKPKGKAQSIYKHI